MCTYMNVSHVHPHCPPSAPSLFHILPHTSMRFALCDPLSLTRVVYVRMCEHLFTGV